MNQSGEHHTSPVLITGGGISGLSMALFLLQQGICPLLIERHKTTSIHPRARGFDIRTMELYRGLQLSEAIREAGKVLAPAWGIRTAPSLAALMKKKKPRKEAGIQSPVQMKGLEALMALSPETGSRCTQDLSEPVLLQAAVERGADIRFYTELVSFEQDANGVTAIIQNRETGIEETIHAAYMIAADGAKSTIRETLQVNTVGAGALGNLLNIYFEADLAAFVRGREFSILRIDEPAMKGMLTSINNSDRWVFHLHYDRAKDERPEHFTHERLITILQSVIGLPGISIRIISVLPWQPTVKVVTEMQHGRIFLAGDAAHTMPPYGGKGANTGVQDTHNLAWKLAMVLQGKAGTALLRTYSTERQPIGLYNAEQSGKMANEYGLIKKVIPQFLKAFLRVIIVSKLRLNKLFPRLPMRQLGNLLGLPAWQYSSSAAYNKIDALQAEPGTRLPHVWVPYQGRQISTLDLLGKSFVLFTGERNDHWKEAALHITQQYGIDLPVYSMGLKGNLVTTEKDRKEVFDITDTGAILVRPDGFVAWRYKEITSAPGNMLHKALEEILCL